MAPLVKFVFVFTSASGGGKSFAVEFLADRFGVLVVPKFSDRPPRSGSSAGPGEPVCVSADEFSRLVSRPGFYQYRYGEYRYGFFRHDIVRLLQVSVALLLIVGDLGVVRALESDFVGIARIIPVIIRTDADLIRERLRRAGYAEREITARMQRSAQSTNAVEAAFQHVLDNNVDRPWFEAQLRDLANHYMARQVVAA
jgi:guanylate kinase